MEIAVIGVGTTGVSALRWCQIRNLKVTGFDKESTCGGIWKHGSPHSPAYDSLYTNSSGVMMSLGDFEKKFKGKFPKHDETCEYYEEYMKLYQLKQLVKWNTIVVGLYKEGSKWIIISKKTSTMNDDTTDKYVFDKVMVCTGKLWDPQYPIWAQNSKTTKLHISHSRDYRNPKNFAGKKVLIVGVGNSALDISLELSKDPNVIKPILVSCRRGTVVLPTDDLNGDPFDPKLTSRAFQYLSSPSARAILINKLVFETNQKLQQMGLPPPTNTKNLFAVENSVSNLKDAYGYIKSVEKGYIKFVPGAVDFFEEEYVKLLSNNNESPIFEKVDSVIFCTGYRIGLDFLQKSVRNDVLKVVKQKNGRSVEYLDLHKSIVYARDPSLAFLTFLTSYGNESIVGSMQARWVTRFWSDETFAKKVFDVGKYEKSRKSKEKFVYESNTPVPYFIRYLPYMDELATDLDCLPDISKRLLNPFKWPLVFKLLFGPTIAFQYYLDGPDSFSGAEKFISSL